MGFMGLFNYFYLVPANLCVFVSFGIMSWFTVMRICSLDCCQFCTIIRINQKFLSMPLNEAFFTHDTNSSTFPYRDSEPVQNVSICTIFFDII